MDPTANLAEQLCIATRMQENDDAGESPDTHDALRLAELVIALDEWIRSGGFLPTRWTA
jgi:hypothetical protein